MRGSKPHLPWEQPLPNNRQLLNWTLNTSLAAHSHDCIARHGAWLHPDIHRDGGLDHGQHEGVCKVALLKPGTRVGRGVELQAA